MDALVQVAGGLGNTVVIAAPAEVIGAFGAIRGVTD
jgi:hypothetical protein